MVRAAPPSRRVSSFTEAVVAELAPHVPPLRCCRAALLSGVRMAGSGPPDGDTSAPAGGLLVLTTRSPTARLALATLHTDGVPAHIRRIRAAGRTRWEISAVGDPGAPWPPSGGRPAAHCDQALLRGAFLQAGWAGRPDAPPHLEIGTVDERAAAWIAAAFERQQVAAVVTRRRGRAVILVRTSDGVAAALSLIGASGGRLRFEEGRVVREVRAGVNRMLNSETANLRRTVDAAHRQVGAARRLEADGDRWRALPAAVRDAASLRLVHPVESLRRLADRAGVSRSAMADRLRRLEVIDRAAGGDAG